MSLLFIDGFDHYATADITKKWTTNAGGTIGAVGRRGSNGLSFGQGNTSITKTIANEASLIAGFSYKYTGTITGVPSLIMFIDAATAQCYVRFNANGTLSIINAAGAVVDTTVEALAPGSTYYIEFKATIADSIAANSCQLRINGVLSATAPAGSNMKATANAYANVVRLSSGSGSHFVTSSVYDDFYLCDNAGATNNDFLGDIRIDTVFPDSDGFYLQGTPSTGTTHYTLVDEATPNTTDYVSLAAIDDRDCYGFAALPAIESQQIFGVQVCAATLKSDSGLRSASTFARSGTTNADGTGVALSTSQAYVVDIYANDPNTSAAWTEGNINAAQFGVKVTA